jgi:phage terminase small subunit
MMEKSNMGLIEVPARELMGPAMRRLNPNQQRFVCALGVFGGQMTEAYKWAGFGSTTDRSAQSASSRLAAKEDVKEAIREEALRRMDNSTLLAVSTVIRIAQGADDKLALKAAELLMDRTGFHAKSEHKVVIEDGRTTNELIDFIRSRSAAHGLDANAMLGLPNPNVVEAEYEDVVDGTDGLEDLL